MTFTRIRLSPRRLAIIAAVLPSLALAGCATDLNMDGDTILTTSMTGAAEAPGPGDPDGSGSATVRIDTGTSQICWDLSVSGIAPATAAHIHRGALGMPGPVVVPLSAPTPGMSSGCVDVDSALANEIMTLPGGFYVNVHNAEFPNGAVRGQLLN